MITSKRLVVIPMMAALSLTGANAYAGIIYQGSDTSNTRDGGQRAAACDHEADGNGVHVDAAKYNENGYSVRADDPNGAAAGCGVSEYTNGIRSHRTVEEIAWKPDAMSAWHVHG